MGWFFKKVSAAKISAIYPSQLLFPPARSSRSPLPPHNPQSPNYHFYNALFSATKVHGSKSQNQSPTKPTQLHYCPSRIPSSLDTDCNVNNNPWPRYKDRIPPLYQIIGTLKNVVDTQKEFDQPRIKDPVEYW